MEHKDQEYVNKFADVHKKAKAARDRMLEASRRDADLRDTRSVGETKEIIDGEPK